MNNIYKLTNINQSSRLAITSNIAINFISNFIIRHMILLYMHMAGVLEAICVL